MIVVAVLGVLGAVAGIAVAAGFALTTSHLGAAAVTTPQLFPTKIVLADKGGLGHQTGRPDAGDTITLTYSGLLSPSTICSSWSGTGSQSGTTVTVDINKAAAGNGDDTITVDNTTLNVTCTSGLHIGTIDMGATGYCTTTTLCTFNKSGIALTQGSTQSTLVVTLGTLKTGTVGRVSTSTTATYTPDTAIHDTASNAIGSNLAANTAVQF